MTFNLIDDRNSGGCYGEEEEPIECAMESSDESLGYEHSRGPRGSRGARTGSDEMEELCW